MKRICGSCFSCFETSKNNEYKEGTKDKILVGFTEPTVRKPKLESKSAEISESTRSAEKKAPKKQNVKVFVVPDKNKNQDEKASPKLSSTPENLIEETTTKSGTKLAKAVNFLPSTESANLAIDSNEIQDTSEIAIDSYSNEVIKDFENDTEIPTKSQDNVESQDFSEFEAPTEPAIASNPPIKPVSPKTSSIESTSPVGAPVEPDKDSIEGLNDEQNEPVTSNKMKVKRKLKSLVQKFIVESCTNGQNLTVLDIDTGSMTPALFKIDQDVKSFNLEFDDGTTEYNFEWNQINSIKLGEQIDESLLKNPEMKSEKSKIIKLESNTNKRVIWLHFESEEKSDNFYACFKILRLADVITKSHCSEEN